MPPDISGTTCMKDEIKWLNKVFLTLCIQWLWIRQKKKAHVFSAYILYQNRVIFQVLFMMYKTNDLYRYTWML